MMECNLVLSGGGARGFAHLGVIKALQENEIDFVSISATSSGAVIGALLCDGYTTDQVIKICHEALPLTKWNFHFTKGILSIDPLNNILSKYLDNKNFNQLKKPLFISATDLNNGKQVIFNQGKVVEAVIASASIPIIFPPAFINNIPYADGGMSGNLPVEPFIKSHLKTIGVHVNPLCDYNNSSDIAQQIERLIHLGIKENVLREMEKLDFLIEPEGLKNYGLFDTDKIDEIIQLGYDHTMKNVNIKEFVTLISDNRHDKRN
jgi:NTE family protein